MSNKRNVTYKCPYCDKRFNKENLVIHVGDKHDDMIPENYSAFRLVFDYINKKPSNYNGRCIICGKESGWDEVKGKYNRICSNPACKAAYIKTFEDRMIKSKGVKRISSTAEGQAKMLANRKISGSYKFSDGGAKTYTGTYEKKALEFMDKVMNIKSEDISTPGPIMEYMFEGKKHIYISDIYYAPYNLIIEVKDGGDNPNNRSMPEYRAKQIAKEKYIIKYTDYNYLRLTNNDFSQLLAVFIELKMEMSNDIPERVIRINEGIVEESNIPSEIKSDKDLLEWMKKNISYSNFTKLKSHDEVLKTKSGSCHDQVMFEYEELKKLGYSPRGLFIIENNKGQGGTTHSLVYYKKGNKICWFENAWGGQEGISEYNSLNDIKNIIKNNKWGNINGHLEFKSFSVSTHKPGETLQQFIDICLGQTNESYYIEERSLPSGPVILYHGSINGNYDKILNNSPNTGKRYEVARTSSFWFKEKEYAEMFATAELLQELSDKKIFILIDNDMKTLVNDQYKSLALNIIKNNNCYVYSKTIDGKNVTGGQARNFPEYTIDFIVKPDDVESVSYKNKLNSIKFVSKDYIDKIIEKYKKDKMTYNNGLFGQIKDSLIYSGTKDIWDTKRTMKKYNESYIEESEKLSDYDFIDIKSHKPLSLKYLQDNSETKKYAKDTIDNYNGELVIYNDSMIGRILVGDKKDKGFITDFSIDEDHRGNKLGSKLLDDAINKYHGVDLVVDKSNTLALDMYKRRGFVIIKTNKDIGDQYYMKLKSKLDKDDKILNEGFFKSEPDILYNKEAFDNGDINICFVTGQSGSGKSTLAHSQESKKVEVYEMDDLQCVADRFTMANLKEYGDLIYTYFKGPGKQFYTTWEQLKEDMTPGKDYEDKLYPGFVAYAIDWAKKHKDKKYIIEGVWLFCDDETGKPYFEPSYFKDYAFYIKGTSAIKSKYRAAKRDMKYDQKEESHSRLFWIKSFTKSFFFKNWKWYKLDEKRIDVFRDYFKNKPETVLSESVLLETSISRYKKIKIDRSLIESDPVFKHLREDHCRGYAFYDKDKLVGFVNVEGKEGEFWIQALEIMPDYRNQGLGKSILDIAVKDLKARYLSVNKKNDIAISLYKKYGFKIYKETESMYFMSLDEEISESLGYYTYNTGVEVYNSSKEMRVLNRVLAGKVNSTNYKWYYINIDSYVPETAKKIQGSIVTLYGFKEQPKTNNLLREAPDTLYEIKYNNYYVRQSDLNKRLVPFMYGNGAPKKGFIILSEGGEYIMDNNISEAMNALMTGFIPGSVDNPNNVYIVNYMQNNVFSGEDPNEDCIGVSSDPLFTNMIIRGKDGILKKVDESFLDDKSYKVYIAEKSIKDISETISSYIDKEVEFGFLYEAVTGKKLYTRDQIGLEGVLIPTADYYTYMDQFKEVCDNFFFAKDKQEIPVSETFIPSKVRYFNNSGLMYESDTNNDIDSYIQAKPEKILEYLDISIN